MCRKWSNNFICTWITANKKKMHRLGNCNGKNLLIMNRTPRSSARGRGGRFMLDDHSHLIRQVVLLHFFFFFFFCLLTFSTVYIRELLYLDKRHQLDKTMKRKRDDVSSDCVDDVHNQIDIVQVWRGDGARALPKRLFHTSIQDHRRVVGHRG